MCRTMEPGGTGTNETTLVVKQLVLTFFMFFFWSANNITTSKINKIVLANLTNDPYTENL